MRRIKTALKKEEKGLFKTSGAPSLTAGKFVKARMNGGIPSP